MNCTLSTRPRRQGCQNPPKLSNFCQKSSYVYITLAFCFMVFCLLLIDTSNIRTPEVSSKRTKPSGVSDDVLTNMPLKAPNPHGGTLDEYPFNAPGTAPDDPTVIEYLRTSVLQPPSLEPYNLKHNSSYNPSMGQAQIIDKVLQGKVNGFFVECGGFDGESYSNSLLFERDRGWRGLMIEADSDNFVRMKAKNRKAYIAQSCLAETAHPKKVMFKKFDVSGHIFDQGQDKSIFDDDPSLEPVQCFPLYSFLVALHTTAVDYLSLDLEGSEYDVLRHIPWDKVDISTLSVEYHAKYETYDKILALMERQGYVLYDKVKHHLGFAADFIFVKEDILHTVTTWSPTNVTAT